MEVEYRLHTRAGWIANALHLANSPQFGQTARMSDSEALFRDTLADGLADWPLSITDRQAHQCWLHFEAVVEANRSINLTRITDVREAAIKHYVDSLALAACAADRQWPVSSMLDVGAGAGLPAIPIAIVRPDWQVTAIDGTAKKMRFLSDAATKIGLTNLVALHAHTNHWPVEVRFHLVTARAVGSLAKTIESTAKYIAPGGRLAVFKTAALPEAERTEAIERARKLGLQHEDAYAYELRLGDEAMARLLQVFRRG